MAKVLVIAGSPRKSVYGQRIAAELGKCLKAHDFEIVCLRDHDIRQCLGCMACYKKGDAACPHKDDMQIIYKKMHAADAVIFLTPVYVMGITGLMKNWIDRLSFICHRPQFSDKHALLIAYAPAYGTNQTLSALRDVASMWEYNITGSLGLYLDMAKPVLALKDRQKINRAAEKLSRALARPLPVPSMRSLILFYLRKEAFRRPQKGIRYEHEYWKEKGWLVKNACFYREAKVSWLKRTLARMITGLILRMPR